MVKRRWSRMRPGTADTFSGPLRDDELRTSPSILPEIFLKPFTWMHMKKLYRELYRRCWTQKELSERSGVSRAMVCAVVNGERNPGPKTRRALSNALRVRPEILFARRAR